MNVPAQCGDVKPPMMFGLRTGPEIRCARRPGHLLDHRDATELHKWPQIRIITAEELEVMVAEFRADPSAFKIGDWRNY